MTKQTPPFSVSHAWLHNLPTFRQQEIEKCDKCEIFAMKITKQMNRLNWHECDNETQLNFKQSLHTQAHFLPSIFAGLEIISQNS